MTAKERITEADWNDKDNSRLALLARLSAPPHQLAAERRTLPQGREERLQALLTEIDEIVLPRVLHLESGAQDVARLVISNRRLIDIELPGQSALPNDSGSLPHLLATRLNVIAQSRGTLLVIVGRRSNQPTQAEAACSVASLRQALALTATQTGYDQLQRRVEAQSIALTQWDLAVASARFTGPEGWKKPLQTLAERFAEMGRHPQADARVGPQGTQGAAIPIAGKQILIMASLEKRGFVAILPYEVGLKAIADWQTR